MYLGIWFAIRILHITYILSNIFISMKCKNSNTIPQKLWPHCAICKKGDAIKGDTKLGSRLYAWIVSIKFNYQLGRDKC